jgi:hypothetical protein
MSGGKRKPTGEIGRTRDYVRSQGCLPRSPRPDEPNFDLAWEEGRQTFVAEVKSITLRNEEKQLRLGLGQVLRYRQLLGRPGRIVEAVLALEKCPTDDRWLELCRALEVSVVWPGTFQLLEATNSISIEPLA